MPVGHYGAPTEKVLTAYLADLIELADQIFIIIVVESDQSALSKSIMRLARSASVDPKAIECITFKLVLDPILEAIAHT